MPVHDKKPTQQQESVKDYVTDPSDETSRLTREEANRTPVGGGSSTYADANASFGGGSFDLESLLSAPLDLTQISKRVGDIMEMMRTKLQTAEQTRAVYKDIGLLVVDSRKFLYPAIIAYHVQNNGTAENTVVSYSVMLVEDETPLAPRTISLGQHHRPVEIYDVANNTFNEVYNSDIKTLLANEIPSLQAGATLVWGGLSFIPRELEITDSAMATALMELAKQVTSARYAEVNSDSPNAQLGNVLVQGNFRIQARLAQNVHNLKDAVAQPIAASLVITTTASRNEQNHNNGNLPDYNQQPPIEIGKASMVTDLRYVPPQATNVSQWGRQQVEDKTQYVCECAITSLSDSTNTTMSLSSLLMVLSSTMIAANEQVFPMMLMPDTRNADSYPTPWDFGAVGYELPKSDGKPGTPFNLYSAEFQEAGQKRIYQLITDLVSQNIVMSLDIPEMILGSRAIKVFQDIAMGTSVNNNGSPVEQIIKTADNLTNNSFSNIADNMGWDFVSIVSPDSIKIPLGYWIDSKGNRRDLREINYLAALQHTGDNGNERFITDWENTFAAGDSLLKANERIALMKDIVGENNVVIKGYADRFLLDNTFMQALAQATVQMGIAPSFDQLDNQSRNRVRGYSSNISNYQIQTAASMAYGNRVFGARNSNRPTTVRMHRQSFL